MKIKLFIQIVLCMSYLALYASEENKDVMHMFFPVQFDGSHAIKFGLGAGAFTALGILLLPKVARHINIPLNDTMLKYSIRAGLIACLSSYAYIKKIENHINVDHIGLHNMACGTINGFLANYYDSRFLEIQSQLLIKSQLLINKNARGSYFSEVDGKTELWRYPYGALSVRRQKIINSPMAFMLIGSKNIALINDMHKKIDKCWSEVEKSYDVNFIKFEESDTE